MGRASAIQWTKSTFNPWLGCTKVSPACDHCYAEGWSNRTGIVTWGKDAPRRRTSAATWRQVYQWNALASKSREFWPVFCGSLCDIGEDNPQLVPWREDLTALVSECRALTFQFLTKRPQNYRRLFPEFFFEANPHVWAGTTVESPAYLNRIDDLKECGAKICFLSVEPLLAPIPTLGEHLDGIQWVIVGCESGPGARPMLESWALNIRHQTEQAGARFFMKQLSAGRTILHQIETFPKVLQVRDYPL